jgi:hypothetical protein
MKFCIRVDDIGWAASKKIDHSLQLAREFHAAMQGLQYLAAVIPAWVGSKGLEWLASKPEGMAIALHGWSHKPDELRDRPIERLRDMIDNGARPLRNAGITIEHFVLPFNIYGTDLSFACFHEGIKFIWGGGTHDTVSPANWPTPPQPYPLDRITFVPSWLPTYAAALWKMGEDDTPLIETLPVILDNPGKAIITLHITWEAAHGSFKGVEWLVSQIKDRVITPAEYLQQ